MRVAPTLLESNIAPGALLNPSEDSLLGNPSTAEQAAIVNSLLNGPNTNC